MEPTPFPPDPGAAEAPPPAAAEGRPARRFHLTYRREHAGPSGPAGSVPPAGARLSAAAPVLVVQAASAVSTRPRGEPNAYNLVEVRDGRVCVAVRSWTGSAWRWRDEAPAPLAP